MGFRSPHLQVRESPLTHHNTTFVGSQAIQRGQTLKTATAVQRSQFCIRQISDQVASFLRLLLFQKESRQTHPVLGHVGGQFDRLANRQLDLLPRKTDSPGIESQVVVSLSNLAVALNHSLTRSNRKLGLVDRIEPRCNLEQKRNGHRIVIDQVGHQIAGQANSVGFRVRVRETNPTCRTKRNQCRRQLQGMNRMQKMATGIVDQTAQLPGPAIIRICIEASLDNCHALSQIAGMISRSRCLMEFACRPILSHPDLTSLSVPRVLADLRRLARDIQTKPFQILNPQEKLVSCVIIAFHN